MTTFDPVVPRAEPMPYRERRLETAMAWSALVTDAFRKMKVVANVTDELRPVSANGKICMTGPIGYHSR